AYSRVLPRIGNFRPVATFGVTDKVFDSDVDFAGEAIGVDVRSRPLHFDYTGEHGGESSRTRFSVTAVANLSGGGDNDDRTYAETRVGADSNWSLLRADFYNEKSLDDYTLRTVVALQYADEALISGEQFGIGGARSVRGFDEREIAGDRGLRARLEVIAPRFEFGARWGWFLDGGVVERIGQGDVGTSRVEAMSTGITMSWEVNRRLSMQADIAHVLNLSGEAAGGSTQEDDSRAHFNVTYYFE
ncbi:MAG: hypothetical protein DWQ08_14425, partial [Proteobacteria bacterium]